MSDPEILWEAPPKATSFGDRDILVLAASLDLPAARLSELARSLSEDERARMARYRFAQHRDRFMAARGMLREILASLLDVQARDLVFSYGEFGKPRLATPIGNSSLHFNLAHSDSLVLYALSRQQVLGIDVERLRPVPEADDIRRRFFSAQENEFLGSLPPSQRTEAFFNCWTRKEAYLKAVGHGLNGPLTQIEVTLLPDEPARFLRIGDEVEATSNWSLQTLKPARDYVGALAVNSPAVHSSHWRWPGYWEK